MSRKETTNRLEEIHPGAIEAVSILLGEAEALTCQANGCTDISEASIEEYTGITEQPLEDAHPADAGAEFSDICSRV